MGSASEYLQLFFWSLLLVQIRIFTSQKKKKILWKQDLSLGNIY